MIKIIHRYIRGRWERYYFKSHWHLVLDLSLSIVIIVLISTVAGLYFYHPNLPWFGQSTPPAVDLNNPPLELNYSVASSTLKIKSAAILKIDFKNNGAAAIDNIVIDLITTDNNFTVSRLEAADDSFLQINGREIVIPQIKAGESGEAVLGVYFNQKNSAVRTINWQAQSQYYFVSQLLKTTSNLTPLILAAELEAKESVYYTSPQGDQLGTGPIPPIAGIPTTYWLFFKAENSGAEVRDFLMSAQLPANVVFTGTQTLSAGTVSYQASRHLLIWKISDLPKEKIGYSAGLEIALTPLKKQVGKFCPLAGNIRYSAHDQEADYDFSGQLKDMTSALDFDKINQGQGKVEAQE